MRVGELSEIPEKGVERKKRGGEKGGQACSRGGCLKNGGEGGGPDSSYKL